MPSSQTYESRPLQESTRVVALAEAVLDAARERVRLRAAGAAAVAVAVAVAATATATATATADFTNLVELVPPPPLREKKPLSSFFKRV